MASSLQSMAAETFFMCTFILFSLFISQKSFAQIYFAPVQQQEQQIEHEQEQRAPAASPTPPLQIINGSIQQFNNNDPTGALTNATPRPPQEAPVQARGVQPPVLQQAQEAPNVQLPYPLEAPTPQR